jgi:cellulose synthase/poly-beta-1,6-N-acetylglucosamine synthase-like glycosyltransferase
MRSSLAFALVIPARNEARLIGEAIRHIRRLEYPRDKHQVFVVADNCTDNTAAVALAEGVHCLERWDPINLGKGKALRWFCEEAREALLSFDAVVVLDADSRVTPPFLKAIAGAFTPGVHVVQSYIWPVPDDHSPVSVLAAYSELLEQEIDRKVKAHLEWPVSLKGKGMAFRTPVLRSLVPRLLTKAEDAELSMLLARKRSCAFAPAAVLYDCSPTGAAKAATQRARWLQGQWGVWRHHWRDILHLLIRGDLGQRALVFSVLLKPKALLFSAKALLLCMVMTIPFLPESVRSVGAVSLSGAVLVDIAYYFIGLTFVGDARVYAQALLVAPLYVVMWLWGLLRAIVSREAWPRARD